MSSVQFNATTTVSPTVRLPLVMLRLTAKFRFVPSSTASLLIVSVPFRSVIVPLPVSLVVTPAVSVPASVTVTLSDAVSTSASSTTGRSNVTEPVPSATST